MGTQFVTSKDGTRIAYEIVGEGPPLLYVDGALGFRDMVFARRMRAELSKSFTLYAYDRRGRGESGDTKPYSVAREVDDIRALTEAAGGNPFVAGTSSGAALALEAAASGVPMRKLAAHEPPYVQAGGAGNYDPQYQEKVTRLIEQGRREDAVRLFMRVVGVPRPMVWAMRFMPFWKDAVAAAHTLPYDAEVMGHFEVPAKRLAEITTPTVVMVGGKTAPRLRAAADATAKAVPRATERVIPKQNHGIAPEALRRALVAEFGAAA